MPLSPATKLGPYEIVAPLGAGGMGEVYRARDTKLHRDVAIKVLPELLSSDADRRARFEREAQLLASINHPNIAAIYGVQEAATDSGAPSAALVLELVEGPTLADRLAHGPLPLDDALSTARQIAEALEAAHAHGIVHRDLKPANIKLGRGGTVKVLDFGLAKAVAPATEASVAHSPTFTAVGTQYGVILGTAAYMSPEQAKGKPADHRADIWAFGVVLYEMLAGRMLYSGDTASEILARVIEREPDWKQVPIGTPPAIVRLMRRCLVKDPRRRLQSMGDARVEIEEMLAGAGEEAAATTPSRSFPWFWAAVIVLAAAVAAALAGFAMRPTTGAASPGAIRAAIPLPAGLYLDGNGPPEIALSADGRKIAFLARASTGPQQLYVRSLDAENATLVPGSETAEGPIFSPDSRWIAFAVGVSGTGINPPELRKYSIQTGLTETIVPVNDYFGGVWMKDDMIAFVDNEPMGLKKVSASGGPVEDLVARFRIGGRDVQRAIAWPDLLPDGNAMLVTDWGENAFGTLAVVDLRTRELVRLGVEGSGARYLPSGHIVYTNRNRTLMAAAFDPVARRLSGRVAVMSDVALGRGAMPAFAFAPNGTVVYGAGYLRWSRIEPMRLIRVTRAGQVTMLPFEPDLFRRGLALSPDGESLVAGSWPDTVWLFDLSRGTRIKLGSAGTNELGTIALSPDGRRLATGGSSKDDASLWGLFVQNADGSGNVETLVKPIAGEVHVAGWMPDSRGVVAWEHTRVSAAQIVRFDPAAGRRLILEERGGIMSAQPSPDGRWLAYDSTASGIAQIYVIPLSGEPRRVAVTSVASRFPVWSRDGRELFFRRDRLVLAVDVTLDRDRLRIGAERKLFEWNVDANREFAVGPDGSFYAVEAVPGAAQQTNIQLRTDWFTAVSRLVAGGSR